MTVKKPSELVEELLSYPDGCYITEKGKVITEDDDPEFFRKRRERVIKAFSYPDEG